MTTAFLATTGSTLGERVARLVPGECARLDTAPERVRIDDCTVTWGGARLDAFDAVLVESALVPWPQPIAEARPGEAEDEHRRRGFASRERRALHVAALRALAGRVRVANEPRLAAELAASAPLALVRLEAAGLAVRPWRVLARPSGAAGWIAFAISAELGLAPAAGPDRPCFEVELAPEDGRALLVLDGEPVAAARCADALARRRATTAASPPERDLARAALSALGLDFGCVHVAGGAVAAVEASPDLDAWDLASDGAVARAFARWLSRPRTPSPRP